MIVHEWTVSVDHKKIGVMYFLMAVVFLVIAGIEAEDVFAQRPDDPVSIGRWIAEARSTQLQIPLLERFHERVEAGLRCARRPG